MKVFVIAGEASGDKLGGALMAGLSSMQDVQYEGVGGPMMEAQGLTSLFDMEELSVMGLIEILPRYFDLKRRITETAQAVLRSKPDLLIGIDSPDFCLRVAKIVKAQSRMRVVHYVAPSVWAWRPGRAQKMVGVVDQVLALLPFEPPYLENVGIECDFVGHPVAAEPLATPEEMTALREELGFGAAPVLLVLPGSRKSEVDRMAPIYGAALRSICAARPDLRVLVPTIGPRVAQVREAVKDWAGAPVLLAPQGEDAGINSARKRAGFALASAALATSGTVSLELAAADTPMVIAYDTNWLTREIIRRMLRIDTLTLVNLVSETRDIPEFLAENCRADLIAPAILKLLDAPAVQQNALRLTMDRLGRGGQAPGLRAAQAVLARLPA